MNDAAWLDAIEDQYGVRLGPGQIYDQRGQVYAGSEYVATLGSTDDPQDATQWSDSLNHMPRYGKGIETAERELDNHGYYHGTPSEWDDAPESNLTAMGPS